MEGDDAAHEMRIGKAGNCVRIAARQDLNVFIARAAIPFDLDVHRAEQFPAGGIGHGQRQAAIGMAICEGVHPVAIGARGHHLWRDVVDLVAIEMHEAVSRAVLDGRLKSWPKGRHDRNP